MYGLLSELNDNPRGDSGDTEDVSHLVTGTEMAALAQKEPMLDEAVKKPCAESRLCVWGHTGKRPESQHAPQRQRALDITSQPQHGGLGIAIKARGPNNVRNGPEA